MGVSSKCALIAACCVQLCFTIAREGWQAECKQSDVISKASDWLLRMPFVLAATKFAPLLKATLLCHLILLTADW